MYAFNFHLKNPLYIDGYEQVRLSNAKNLGEHCLSNFSTKDKKFTRQRNVDHYMSKQKHYVAPSVDTQIMFIYFSKFLSSTVS